MIMEQTPLSDKKIVVIGGGTGIFPVLTGLKKCRGMVLNPMKMKADWIFSRIRPMNFS